MKHLDKNQNACSQSGFIFSVASLGISLILGFFVMWTVNSVSFSSTVAAENLSTTQSNHSTTSGVNFSTQWIHTNGVNGVDGFWNFYNSVISISTSTYDRFGNALPGEYIRVVSKTDTGNSIRKMEALFRNYSEDIWPELSFLGTSGGSDDDDDDDDDGQQDRVTICHKPGTPAEKTMTIPPQALGGHLGHGDYLGACGGDDDDEQYTAVRMEDDFDFNGTLYIDGNLEIDCNSCIGTGSGAQFFLPTGANVEDDGSSNQWNAGTVQPLSLPLISFPYEDSLIILAQSINKTEGNRIKGNYKPKNITIDVSNFDDNTLFVKGNVYFKGCTIEGGTVSDPGFIVATGKIRLAHNGGVGSTVSDNIIFISQKDLSIERNSRFGIDYSHLSPEARPTTVNELYSWEDIVINDNCAGAWAQAISPQNLVSVKGALHGLLYAPGLGMEWGESPSFEGKLLASRVADPADILDRGSMILTDHTTMHFLTLQNYQLVDKSVIEF